MHTYLSNLLQSAEGQTTCISAHVCLSLQPDHWWLTKWSFAAGIPPGQLSHGAGEDCSVIGVSGKPVPGSSLWAPCPCHTGTWQPHLRSRRLSFLHSSHLYSDFRVAFYASEFERCMVLGAAKHCFHSFFLLLLKHLTYTPVPVGARSLIKCTHSVSGIPESLPLSLELLCVDTLTSSKLHRSLCDSYKLFDLPCIAYTV